jgi:glyoxylase-like metal-dependent hydrolase (beta-lactamase superfamily II)
MQQISPNFYTFTGLFAGRVYAIADEATVTLIDTGMAFATSRLLAQLQKAGYRPEQITRIFITHAHPDHVGGLHALHAASGATLICSTIEKPVLEGKTPVVMPDPAQRSFFDKLINPRPQTLQPITVDQTLNEGDVLESAIGDWQALAAPGHTPGQMALWHPERKILIAADAIMNFPKLRLPFSAFTQNMAVARTTAKRLAALEPAILCCGHGHPITNNTVAKVRAFAATL